MVYTDLYHDVSVSMALQWFILIHLAFSSYSQCFYGLALVYTDACWLLLMFSILLGIALAYMDPYQDLLHVFHYCFGCLSIYVNISFYTHLFSLVTALHLSILFYGPLLMFPELLWLIVSLYRLILDYCSCCQSYWTSYSSVLIHIGLCSLFQSCYGFKSTYTDLCLLFWFCYYLLFTSIHLSLVWVHDSNLEWFHFTCINPCWSVLGFSVLPWLYACLFWSILVLSMFSRCYSFIFLHIYPNWFRPCMVLSIPIFSALSYQFGFPFEIFRL